MSLPPEITGNIASIALTLLVAGVGYIARQAHTISIQVGRVYRTLFGEDGTSGMHVQMQEHRSELDDHGERIIRMETELKIPRNRTRDER
jgi:hypothetical protein